MATSNNTPELKRCAKCQQMFPPTTEYFHRSTKASDGLRYECKGCRVGNSHKYYEQNAEKIKAYAAQWQRDNYDKWYGYEKKNRHANPLPTRERAKQYAKANPEKRAAYDAVKYAIKSGKLIPPSKRACAKCGLKALHYHHWSYAPEHRLDVTPLCAACHKTTHANLEVIP